MPCAVLLHGDGSFKWPEMLRHHFMFVQAKYWFISPVSDAHYNSLSRSFLYNFSCFTVGIAC